MGPWNCLGNRALTDPQYSPDFDAVAVAPVRVLRIRRQAFFAAMEATSLLPVVDYQVRGPARGLHACRARRVHRRKERSLDLADAGSTACPGCCLSRPAMPKGH